MAQSKWNSIKPGLWGAVGGATLIMVVGFSQLGWRMSSTAEKMAQSRADAAVVAVLTPIRVDKYMKQAEAPLQLAAFKKLASWDQRSSVEKGGWAKSAGNADPSSDQIAACAVALSAKVIPGQAAELKN